MNKLAIVVALTLAGCSTGAEACEDYCDYRVRCHGDTVATCLDRCEGGSSGPCESQYDTLRACMAAPECTVEVDCQEEFNTWAACDRMHAGV